ncbi:protein-disulfide reductase DsbD [uncultured Thiohalocapsa sp.]|uniref:protein-disulfide reductase DsbD n=1 Tax=uncultured Thiohalocapsa sp. TaxID=768990 RepID=UPI0025F54FDE|nr:protein-disulfide reductase DsbD [uncultured Thiohalocapsa sp.]
MTTPALVSLAAMLLLVLAHGVVTAATDDDFRQPDQAFRISGESAGADAVTVRWDIEPGYYMYRSKFRFDSESPGISLGRPDLPPSETKQDEFFGEVQIYRDRVEARLPVERSADAGDVVAIEAKSQGCADAGLCYPPQKQRILLELPKLAAVDTADSAGSADGSASPAGAPAQSMAQALSGGGGGGVTQSLGLGIGDDILPVEEAFRFDAEVAAPDRLALIWDIAPETYLYQEKIALSLEDADGVQIGEYSLPEAEVKPDTVRPDGTIGDVAIYHGTLNLDVPLRRGASEPTEVTLVANYQGCAERGICYPPVTERIALALPAATETVALAEVAPASAASGADGDAAGGPPERVSEQDQIAARLANAGILGAMAIFFGLGLLLAFTPCVFPMIPILSGIIAGQGDSITTRKAFFLSLAYVLAMALTYAIVGVIAGLFGANLQATFQNVWVLSAFALVFVALSLSMFGFYELQLPSSWQSKLTEMSNKQEGGTLAGAAIMGALSALIVGPCVAPPLMGALIFIGKTGDAVLGFFALLGLGLGMGAPLLAIGTSAGKLLPRAGMWMDAVKAVFGVLLLAVAILLIERVLPPAVAMLLWGLLLIASGVYMGALTTITQEAGGWTKLWKALGLALLVYGVLMIVGAAAGGRDTIQPLRGIVAAGGGQAAAHKSFTPIKTVADLEREIAAASAAGKPVMLDFYADWCVSCKEMERYTFPDPDVIAALDQFVVLQADVTANDAEDKALMQERFGIPGPPAMLFFDESGEELRGYRLVGFVPADEFAAHLNEIAP